MSADDPNPQQLGEKLLAAVGGGEEDELARLLDAGASVDSQDAVGRTALALASASAQLAVVAKLLERGAGLEISSKSGMTPLMVAALKGHADVATLLLRNGANVAAQDMFGRVSLMFAAAGSHADVVRVLLEHGADAAVRDRNGLDAAAMSREPTCSDTLRSADRIQRWHRRRLLVLWGR
ncbi:hypothetical protein FNF27_00323 [Cafeteria roenbergensis]|nr:hypothetical protein FNF29_01456 [Cafeteria roenbergensis]KAA0178474.1 hypothetical protein FNF27_00323 [Cafeteria roenbergensis]|eukprot:KAA0156038.1 hypothetical protein FNF29_01456 [Cafeteria roenbergensis]